MGEKGRVWVPGSPPSLSAEKGQESEEDRKTVREAKEDELGRPGRLTGAGWLFSGSWIVAQGIRRSQNQPRLFSRIFAFKIPLIKCFWILVLRIVKWQWFANKFEQRIFVIAENSGLRKEENVKRPRPLDAKYLWLQGVWAIQPCRFSIKRWSL